MPSPGSYVPQGRFFHAASADENGNAHHVFGGVKNGVFLNDLFVYDMGQNTVTLLNSGSGGPSPRAGACGAVINDSFAVFGGYDGFNYYNDHWLFNFEAGNWTQLDVNTSSAELPSPRAYHSCEVFKGELASFGGMGVNDALYNDFLSYNYEAGVWSTWSSKTAGPSARAFVSTALHGDDMYFYGGYDGSLQSDTWMYEFGKGEWIDDTAAGAFGPLAAYTSGVIKGEYHVLSGYDGTNTTTVFEALPNGHNKQWTAVTSDNGVVPPARAGAKGTGKGNEILLYGGADGYVVGGDLTANIVYDDFWVFK